MPNSTPRISRDIAYLCAQHGIEQVIITPGSRNAPLTMAFQQISTISCLSIVDERSAAFFALGMIQASGKPVALCCTSGTALLNFFPAVAEAFYQELPLMVLSADRPLEKIDQQIGQSIRQSHVLASHVNTSIQLVEDLGDAGLMAFNQRQINEGLIQLRSPSPGPVHLNIPLREPLYESQDFSHDPPPRVFQLAEHFSSLSDSAWNKLAQIWKHSEKTLILVGMMKPDPELNLLLGNLASLPHIVVLADWVSGLTHPSINCEIDRTLSQIPKDAHEDMSPELLISLGNGIVSKRIKQMLTNNPPTHHWHIQKKEGVVDTYESLTQLIPLEAKDFFQTVKAWDSNPASYYGWDWEKTRSRSYDLHKQYLAKAPFSDLSVFDLIHQYLPESWDVHLANSSVIRYMQLFPKENHTGLCWGNRGTSGIDGSTSTAIGYTYAAQRPTLLITGDISFFYDSNAWWNTYIPSHFRAILINNQGGGIFRLIDGPAKGGILDPFQETPHKLSAEHIAQAYGIAYDRAEDKNQVKKCLSTFFEDSHSARILEICTPRQQNAEVWHNYQTFLSSFDL